MGHIDGMIRNNFIAAGSTALFATEFGFDTGISLGQAYGAQLYHNTIASTTPPFSGIERRWENTHATITNNLTTHNLMDRGDSATLAGNISDAPVLWFTDIPLGDLRLTSQTTCEGAGAPLTENRCPLDIDGDERPQSPPQELTNPTNSLASRSSLRERELGLPTAKDVGVVPASSVL